MSHPGRQQCSDNITDSFHSFDSNALWVKGAEHEHLQVFFYVDANFVFEQHLDHKQAQERAQRRVEARNRRVVSNDHIHLSSTVFASRQLISLKHS